MKWYRAPVHVDPEDGSARPGIGTPPTGHFVPPLGRVYAYDMGAETCLVGVPQPLPTLPTGWEDLTVEQAEAEFTAKEGRAPEPEEVS